MSSESNLPLIRVVIADDHAMLREMMRLVLPRAGHLEIVGEAADGRELLHVLERVRADVLLLDYGMPYARDFDGFLRGVRERHPDLHVVLVTGTAHVDLATRAAGAGARGYVLKATRLSGVVDAIRAVAAGGVWIDPTLPRRVFDVFQRLACSETVDPASEGLTRREREVLASLAQGVSNQEIARKLNISEETVKTHLSRVYTKLGVKNRMSAALTFYGRPPAVTA